MRGSRGLRRIACCASATASSSDPVSNLQSARLSNALALLGLIASAVSHSGMASSHRSSARRTMPLARCAVGLRGDAAKARSANVTARAMSTAAASVRVSRELGLKPAARPRRFLRQWGRPRFRTARPIIRQLRDWTGDIDDREPRHLIQR